jgi:hypothetical protein
VTLTKTHSHLQKSVTSCFCSDSSYLEANVIFHSDFVETDRIRFFQATDLLAWGSKEDEKGVGKGRRGEKAETGGIVSD